VRLICSHCTDREEMKANVLKAFEEYPADKLEGIWGCYYNNLRSVMECDGGNDYKQAHNGGKKRKRGTLVPQLILLLILMILTGVNSRAICRFCKSYLYILIELN